jgi:predicted permease
MVLEEMVAQILLLLIIILIHLCILLIILSLLSVTRMNPDTVESNQMLVVNHVLGN